MASKKHRKQLKRIHLRCNAARYIQSAERNFIEAMDSLGKAAESASKFFLNLVEMEIIKENDGELYITCERCTKQCFEIEKMRRDNNNNWICAQCDQEIYDFFFMEETEELKANGEIE